jgi:uncharacterized damage-inducible protein DinB
MGLLIYVIIPALLQAQSATDRTTNTGFVTATYEGVKDYILRASVKMPAEHFDFRPTPDVRSFRDLIAHLTDANYLLCPPALGVPNPNGDVVDNIEKRQLARDALLKELRISFEMCDRAYAGLTDANAADPVPFNGKRPRLGLLWFHVSRAYEHYGNVVTYLRLKGIVPPSSEPRTGSGRRD